MSSEASPGATRARVGLPARGGLLASLAVASSALLVLMLHPDWTPPQLDEMTCLGAGARMLRGERAYVDFHEFLLPGFLFLQRELMAVLGPHLLAFRAVALAGHAAAWIAAWAALRRQAVRPGLLGLVALAGAWTFAWWPVSYAAWWGGALLLAWVLVEARQAREVRPGRAAAIAWVVLIALVGLFSQPASLAACVVLGAAAIPHAVETRQGGALARRIAGVMLAVGIVAVALAASGTLMPMVRDTIAWPLLHYKQAGGANDVSLLEDSARIVAAVRATGGHVAGVLVAGALFVLVLLLPAAFVAAWLGVADDEAARHRRRLALALCLGAGPCFLLAKQDLRHWVMLLPLVLLALALAATLRPPAGRAADRAVRAAWLVAGLSLPAVAAVPLVRSAGPVPGVQAWMDADAPYRAFADLAREAAAENGGSLPVISRAGLLEFYGVPNPLPFSVLLPPSSGYGAVEDQAETAAALDALRSRWVLLYPAWEARAFLTEEGPVSEVLRRDYAPAREREDAILLRRRDAR